MDPQLYRRRQRRRAAIGWGTVALAAILIALVLIGHLVGGGDGDDSSTSAGDLGFLGVAAEMSASDYESIREGEEEETILGRLGSGLREDQAPQELLPLFPSAPSGSHCAFWDLSDAPGHLVRLCFDDDRGVLLQKSVAAKGEGEVPKTPV